MKGRKELKRRRSEREGEDKRKGRKEERREGTGGEERGDKEESQREREVEMERGGMAIGGRGICRDVTQSGSFSF